MSFFQDEILSEVKHKQIKNDMWSCRCPICGDSKKDKTKMRGLFIQKTLTDFFYMCHNCSVRTNLRGFIKQAFPQKLHNYNLSLLSTEDRTKEYRKVEPLIKENKDNYLGINCSNLDEEHLAISYLKSRKLLHLKHIFYYKEDSIVIPFYSKDKKIIGYQQRFFLDHKFRYKSTKLDTEHPFIFGLDRIDYNKTIYVVEGAFDSLFIENCIAVNCSDLTRVESVLPSGCNIIYVWDNEPRNKIIVSEMTSAVKKGKTIVMWDKNILQKDVNDCIKKSVSVDFIYKNHLFGILAELEILKWKQI